MRADCKQDLYIKLSPSYTIEIKYAFIYLSLSDWQTTPQGLINYAQTNRNQRTSKFKSSILNVLLSTA